MRWNDSMDDQVLRCVETSKDVMGRSPTFNDDGFWFNVKDLLDGEGLALKLESIRRRWYELTRDERLNRKPKPKNGDGKGLITDGMINDCIKGAMSVLAMKTLDGIERYPTYNERSVTFWKVASMLMFSSFAESVSPEHFEDISRRIITLEPKKNVETSRWSEWITRWSRFANVAIQKIAKVDNDIQALDKKIDNLDKRIGQLFGVIRRVDVKIDGERQDDSQVETAVEMTAERF